MKSAEAVIDAVREHLRAAIDWNDSRESLIGIQVGVLVCEYVRHYHAADVERYATESVELEIITDVVNPDTGRPSTIWDHASKIDGVAWDRFEDVRKIIEHKTTTQELAAESPYWRKLRIDSQVSKYVLSLRQAGFPDVSSVLYDVVSKPGTKPKRITAKDVPVLAESGTYFGFPVSELEAGRVQIAYENGKGKRGGFLGKLDESNELYGLRLRRLVIDDPSAWFQRRTIIRTDEEVEEYARELWQLAAEMRAARKSQIAPRNSTNCSAFGRLCEFFSLCCGEIDEESDQFERPSFVHSELNSAEATAGRNGGRDILTNSRLTTFQSCRRREKLRYEDGLRQAGKTDSVALFWGSLFHELMEIVWLSYKPEPKRV